MNSAIKVLSGTLYFRARLVQMFRIPNNIIFTHIKVMFLCNVRSMSYVCRIVSFSGLQWWFSASLMCPLPNIYVFLFLAMLLSKMIGRYSYGHT